MIDFIPLGCGHIIRKPLICKTISDMPPCSICAQIKAAEDKRGKEVLDLALGAFRRQIIIELECSPTASTAIAERWDRCRDAIRQAYKERFGEQG